MWARCFMKGSPTGTSRNPVMIEAAASIYRLWIKVHDTTPQTGLVDNRPVLSFLNELINCVTITYRAPHFSLTLCDFEVQNHPFDQKQQSEQSAAGVWEIPC